MPKDGRYHGIEIPLWEALEEIAAGVFEDTGLNDEYAGDICLYDVHDYWLLIDDCWWMITDCWVSNQVMAYHRL